MRAVFELLLGSIAPDWTDGVFEHKAHYSIGNDDGGIGDGPDRLLGYSCEPKYFSEDVSVAGIAG